MAVRREEKRVGAASTAAVSAARRGRPPLGVDVQRRRIIDAASEIFLARGFSDTSIDAIARAAGVTKRTIYELIGDKEAVFRSVCNESSSSVSSLDFPPVVPGMALREVLTGLSRTLLDHALAPERLALSRMITVESMRFPDLVKTALNRGKATMDGAIIAVFEELEALGVVAVPDHKLAAEVFYDVMVGNQAFRATMGFDEQLPSEEELGRRLDVFLRGYLDIEPPRDQG